MRRSLVVVVVATVACGGSVDDARSDGSTSTGSGTSGDTTSGGSGGVVVTVASASGAGPGPSSGAHGGEGGSPDPAGGDGAGGSIEPVGGGGAAGEVLRDCQGHVYACGDTLDNDGDGLTDAADPDCHGACDHDEAHLWHRIGDDFQPCLEDCFFDQDGGSGNDGCVWDFRCDAGGTAPGFDPTGDASCEHDPDVVVPGEHSCADLRAGQSPACLATCGPLVPNGCDCFGCCEHPAGDGRTFWLGSHDGAYDALCATASLEDPTVCRPCEQVPSCINPCDPCEVCIAGTVPEPGCDVAAQCPGGEAACGLPGQPFCPDDTYCVSGCCQPLAR